MQLEAAATAAVELQAVIAETRLTSRELALFVAGTGIEIVPAEGTGPIVTFVIGGVRLARARLRSEEGRLVATIVEMIGDPEQWKFDEWRVARPNPDQG